jgi:lipopolysaccharide biosynthesis glycosyltransferase
MVNNNYTFIIMVSLTSILINSKNTTFIYFHFLIGNDVDSNNINKILSLQKLNFNSKFKFYKVGDNFKGWIQPRKKITVAAFYRSILGELLKKVNKIIYLDGDTLIYNDLTEMYQLNMNNLYFRGVHEILKKNDKNVDKKKYICDGVMLMNLKLIRERKVFDLFKNYYYKYYNKGIYHHDQHIINVLFKNKIGFLPPRFGMWFINENDIIKYKLLNPLIYTEQEIRESINKPVIRHIWGNTSEGFLYNKPWLSKKYFKIKEEWNYYAKKTGYYSVICKSFKYACINIQKNMKKI